MKSLIAIVLVGYVVSSAETINTETLNTICYENVGEYEGMTKWEVEIRETLKEENIEPYHIELLVAQSKHESGNYKNSLTPYNNVFARHYSKRDTFAISAGAPGEGHTRFAKYPSVKSATLSQLWYFRSRGYSFNWKNTYQFAAECKRKGYYEAPLSLYVNALNKYMPK